MKTLTEMYNAKRNKKEHPMITGLKKTMGSSCHKKNGYFEGGSTMPNQEQTADMNNPMNRTMKMAGGGFLRNWKPGKFGVTYEARDKDGYSLVDRSRPRITPLKKGGKACMKMNMGGGIPTTRSPLGGNRAFKKGGKNA